MNTDVNNKKKRGWDALEEKLRERGLSDIEVEEARDSFYKGLELLSRLFLSQYSLEKRISKKEKVLDSGV